MPDKMGQKIRRLRKRIDALDPDADSQVRRVLMDTLSELHAKQNALAAGDSALGDAMKRKKKLKQATGRN